MFHVVEQQMMDFPILQPDELLESGQSSEDEYSDNEDFYFESDHLALRGNADYRAVLRTIVILEAQRIEAAKHIDQIATVQKRALANSEEFLKEVTSAEPLNLPGPINIQNVFVSRE